MTPGHILTHRFTRVVELDRQQWQHLNELVAEATAYLEQIPADQRRCHRHDGASLEDGRWRVAAAVHG